MDHYDQYKDNIREIFEGNFAKSNAVMNVMNNMIGDNFATNSDNSAKKDLIERITNIKNYDDTNGSKLDQK
ncbi:hypothetical protein [Mycoplasmopsis glycophila]|uniref:Uncharacterized protein n=1 Tax=Mycoplasmopsis glycophila TaxID=171285 RepID=A0A449AUU4_9BACT|nr:hypothetical protein [Mycoplasmopsis glycophila]VEU70265.1 Uncharacterised protein [Mycoplasmopsis glycophila]